MEIKELTNDIISAFNKQITNDVFLMIQNDRELMHKYLRAISDHKLDTINQAIGRAVKEAYGLNNDDREDCPSCTLIQSHQKFK